MGKKQESRDREGDSKISGKCGQQDAKTIVVARMQCIHLQVI